MAAARELLTSRDPAEVFAASVRITVRFPETHPQLVQTRNAE